MTERIDHVAIAAERLDLAQTEVSANWPSMTGEEKADLIAVAQVHATLALVEQQRIANLITIAGWVQEQTAREVGFQLDYLRLGLAGEVWDALGILDANAEEVQA